MTSQQTKALDLLATKFGNKPRERWALVKTPETGVWYDFADVETGAYGQCLLLRKGVWAQSPRGTKPVLFAWRGAGTLC